METFFVDKRVVQFVYIFLLQVCFAIESNLLLMFVASRVVAYPI